MRRAVLIGSAVAAASVIAIAVYLSVAGAAPSPSSPDPGGTSTCAPREPAEGGATETDRVPCGDHTGKPGEVKP